MYPARHLPNHFLKSLSHWHPIQNKLPPSVVVRKNHSPQLSAVSLQSHAQPSASSLLCLLLPEDPRDSPISLFYLTPTPTYSIWNLSTHHLQSLEYMHFLLLRKISWKMLLPKSNKAAYCQTAQLLL